MRGVIAFSGSMVPSAGIVVIRLHSKATAAPSMMTAGRSRRWLSVCVTRRAMWGTASPMKAMGPQ